MTSSTRWIEFKPHNKELTKVLGGLEADIMATLWDIQAGSVKRIHEGICQKRKAAITTVATVLDRLYEKGLVERELEKSKSLYYQYRPSVTKKQFEKKVAGAVLKGLFETFGDSAISYLFDETKIKDMNAAEELRRNLEGLKRKEK